MSRVLRQTDSRIVREFLVSMQRARANKENLTIRWPGASAEDIANVSAYLELDIEHLIDMAVSELKDMK